MNYYLLFKSLHLISVISWMAGLLYLPRIFVYHAENNGDRQWPAGYNPKPLIAKSIRNLAVGAINDKFILRRG